MLIAYSGVQCAYLGLGMSSKHETTADRVPSKSTNTRPSLNLCKLFHSAIEDLGPSTSDWWVSQDFSNESNASTHNPLGDDNPIFQFKTPSFLNKTPQLQAKLSYRPNTPCQFEPVLRGLDDLIGNPHSDISWSSSMATPSAHANLTLSNLNTEERKLLVSSEDNRSSTIPRHLSFSSDYEDISDVNVITGQPADYVEPRGVREVLDMLCSPVQSTDCSPQQQSTHDIFSSPTTSSNVKTPLSTSFHLSEQLQNKLLTERQKSATTQSDLSPGETQILHSTFLSPILENPTTELITKMSPHRTPSVVGEIKWTCFTDTNSINVLSNSTSAKQDIHNLHTTPKISVKSRLFRRKKNSLREKKCSINLMQTSLDPSITHLRQTCKSNAPEQQEVVMSGLDATYNVQSPDDTWVTSTPLKSLKRSFRVDSTPIVSKSVYESMHSVSPSLISYITSTPPTVSTTLSLTSPLNCSIVPTSPVLRKHKRKRKKIVTLNVRQPEKECEASREDSANPSSASSSIHSTLKTSIESCLAHSSVIPHTSSTLYSTNEMSSYTSVASKVLSNDLISPKDEHITKTLLSIVTENNQNESVCDFDSFDSHILEEICKATEQIIVVSEETKKEREDICKATEPLIVDSAETKKGKEEICKATEQLIGGSAETATTSLGQNKTFKFNNAVKKKNVQEDIEPKEVASRVKTIRSSYSMNRVFCYPMSVARKEKVAIVHPTIIVDDLIKSAHILEQVANLEPKDRINNLPRSACISELVPFSQFHHHAQDTAIRLPKEKHNNFRSESISPLFPINTSVQREPSETLDNMSCTQVTRLVKDAELMLRSENLFWDLDTTALRHTEGSAVDLNSQNEDTKLASSTVMQQTKMYSNINNSGFQIESDEAFKIQHTSIPNKSRQIKLSKAKISNPKSASNIVGEENSKICLFADGVDHRHDSRFNAEDGNPLNDIKNILSPAGTPVNKIISNCNTLNTAVMKLEGFPNLSRSGIVSESDAETPRRMFSEGKCLIPEKRDSMAPTDSQNTGLSTGSGNKADVSDGCWQKEKHLFLKVEGMINENIKHQSPTSMKINAWEFPMANCKNDISDCSLLKARNRHQFESFVDETTNQTSTLAQIDAVECSIASGKKINISELSMAKANNLFKEIESSINGNTNRTPTLCEIGAGGFSTASGKKINISERYLAKARIIFKEVESSVIENIDQTPTSVGISSGGFSTASGKKVKISERSLAKARNIFKEVECSVNENIGLDQTPTSVGIRAGGFSTASGKKVNISESSLVKARNLFKEDEISINESKDQTPTLVGISSVGFSTASGKKVDISERSLAKARNIFKEVKSSINENIGLDQTPTSVGIRVGGFSTASGKKVNISEGSLAKARNLFKEVERSINESIDQTPISVGISSVGFSTASGKKVNISERSLAKARNIFKEVESSINENIDQTPTSVGISAGGFSTASGKKVNISECSLAKARNMFKEVESTINENIDQTPTSVGISAGGFSTASGKKVNISERSLAKARNIFKEVESSINENTGLDQTPTSVGIRAGGFSTASGKKVNISESSLAKARNLFKEVESSIIENIDQTPTSVGISAGGFSTASGKKVNISERSLAKARNMFKEVESTMNDNIDEIPTLAGISVRGVSTASGKVVSTSEAALRKARHLFIDDHSCRKELVDQQVPNVTWNHKAEVSTGISKCVDVLKSGVNEIAIQSSTGASIRPIEVTSETSKFVETVQNLVSQTKKYNNKPQAASNKSCSSTKAEQIHGYVMPVISSSNNELTSEDAIMLGLSQLTDDATTIGSKRLKFTKVNSSSSCGTNYPCELIASNPSVSLLKSLQPQKYQPNNMNSHRNSATTSFIIDERSRELQSSLNVSQYELDVSEVVDYVEAFSADEALEAPTWVAPLFCSPCELTDRSSGLKPMVDSPLTPPSPIYGPHDRFQSKSKTLQRGIAVQKEEPMKSEAAKSFKVPYTQGGERAATLAKDSMAKKRTALMEFGTPFAKRSQHDEKNKPPGAKCLQHDENKKVEPSSDEIAKLRAQSLEKQKQTISTKCEFSSRPCTGSLLLRKQQEGQMSWSQLAHGRVPGTYTRSQLIKLGVREAVINVTADNAASFIFSAHDHYGPNVCRTNVTGLPVGDSALLVLDAAGQAGVQQVETAFLSSPGIDPKLVPEGWVQNHFRWIVWKLAATERSFPGHFAARCLTPNILMLQLKYRYDREIDRSEHPCIRRILERNEPAARRLILCVAGISKLLGDSGYELQLTDGWYGVTASVDTELVRFVARGVIRVGTKLMTHGAELVGCEQGCYPLEANSNVRLKLCANSTRRARWNTRLGFQANPGPLKMSLTSLLPSGGAAGHVDVYIARVYPTLYVEKKADGSRVTRSGTAEEVAAALFERERQDSVERIYSQVRSELLQTDGGVGKKIISNLTAKNVRLITSGEELNQLMEQSADPSSLQAMMTEEQLSAVAEHRQEVQDVMLREMESRMRETLSDEVTKRDVSSLTKIRCLVPDGNPSSSAILSVWRATEDILALLSEGTTLTIYNVSVTGSRGGCLQLSTGRQTCYKLASYNSFESGSLLRSVTYPSDVASRDFRPPFGEMDTVGVVVHKGAGLANFQTVYLASHDLAVLEVAFWGGIKEFGCEDLLCIGAVVCAVNLQWRLGGSARTIPCAYASENSYFSCHPRQTYLQEAVKKLNHTIQMEWTDMNQFTTVASKKVLNLLRDIPHTRTNYQSPHVAQIKTQSPICSPQCEVTLTPTQQRLEKLRKYADPPPLSPIILSQPRGINNEFQVPFRQGLTAIQEDTSQDSDSPPLSLDSN